MIQKSTGTPNNYSELFFLVNKKTKFKLTGSLPILTNAKQLKLIIQI